jgi:hypothetical protein
MKKFKGSKLSTLVLSGITFVLSWGAIAATGFGGGGTANTAVVAAAPTPAPTAAPAPQQIVQRTVVLPLRRGLR